MGYYIQGNDKVMKHQEPQIVKQGVKESSNRNLVTKIESSAKKYEINNHDENIFACADPSVASVRKIKLNDFPQEHVKGKETELIKTEKEFIVPSPKEKPQETAKLGETSIFSTLIRMIVGIAILLAVLYYMLTRKH